MTIKTKQAQEQTKEKKGETEIHTCTCRGAS